MRLIPLVLALLIVAGCGGTQTAQEAASTADTTAAAGPNLITVSNQTEVWQCPACGMTFDGPGECSMKDGTLAKMNVHYVCPTGGEEMPGVGTCPTHNVEARVEKTVAAEAGAPDTSTAG